MIRCRLATVTKPCSTVAVTREEVFVQVAAALYAAHRTDARPTSLEKDVERVLGSCDLMVDAIATHLNLPWAPKPPETAA